MNLKSHLPSAARTFIQNPLARLFIMAAITSTLVFSAYVTKAHAQGACPAQTSCINSCTSGAASQENTCYNNCVANIPQGQPNSGQATYQCQQGCQGQYNGNVAACQSSCSHVPCQ